MVGCLWTMPDDDMIGETHHATGYCQRVGIRERRASKKLDGEWRWWSRWSSPHRRSTGGVTGVGRQEREETLAGVGEPERLTANGTAVPAPCADIRNTGPL